MNLVIILDFSFLSYHLFFPRVSHAFHPTFDSMHLVKRTVNRNLYDYVRLRTLQRTLFTHTLHIFLHVLTFLVSLMIPHTPCS